MKKYILFAAAALVALSACKKTDEQAPATQEPAKDNTPAWVNDESLPVPVEFGTGQMNISVKGTAVDAQAFAGASYDILAYGTDVMPGFEGGVLVTNESKHVGAVAPGGYDLVVAGFGNTPKYYPYLASAGAFNFYGYRVDGTHQTLNGTSIENISLGDYDILWGKAEPSAANLSALEVANGFNARYIRAARKKCTTGEPGSEVFDDATYYRTYLPQLAFNHITSQIQFVIKAADATAQTTLAGANVAISSIVVGGSDESVSGTTTINNKATLDVVAGTLTGTNLGTIAVQNIPNNFEINTTGANCGEPIFILPMTGDILMTLNITLPGMTEPQVIASKLRAPAVVGTGTQQEPQYAAGTFAAGLAYQYTIILHSIEEIEVVTSLADWIEGGNSDITLE